MGVEIERKFLVRSDAWRAVAGPGMPILQGYFDTAPSVTVRVRLAGERGFLTLKGPSHGFSRSEFEYPIPTEDARRMLAEFCADRLIEKVRYPVRHAGYDWEVDVFSGRHAGLVLAELELADAAVEFPRPAWLGREVSGDSAYGNGALARNPRPMMNVPDSP